MNQRLREKTVLVTGASGGLGKQIARYAARDCKQIILLARNEEKLRKLKEELEKQYRLNVVLLPFDMKRYAELPAYFAEKLPDVTVDVLVNNAGIGKFKTVMDLSMEEVQEMLDVNFLSLVTITKLLLPKMIEQGSGHIINIASQGGKMVTPKASIYGASKKAVLGFSDGLRMEVRPKGIFVTAVNPGPMKTNFFDYADETGQYLNNVGPWVLQVDTVAKKVVQKMMTDTREMNMPLWMNSISKLHTLFPGLIEWIGRPAFYKK